MANLSSYSNEELCLLWYLHEYYQEDTETFQDASKILSEQGIKVKQSDLKFWINHLQENSFIEIHDHLWDKIRIIYPGVKFVRQSPELFQEYVSRNLATELFADDIEKFGKRMETVGSVDVESEESTANQGADIEKSDEPKYWMVGTWWQDAESQERLPLFIERNEWINGYGDDGGTASTLTKQVKPGDIIVAKSRVRNTGALRIKNFATVQVNPLDGEKLEVKWETETFQHDITGWSHYAETIQEVRHQDLYTLQSVLNVHKKKESEPKKQPKYYDKSAFLWSDSPAEIDELGRENLAKSVSESINTLFKKYKDAYTVLLNGEWGSGKSSMLNFFKTYLKDGGWKVIEYNAWENQQFKDPWWILINAISKKATEKNFEGDFASHRRWRFGIQYRNKIWAMAIILVFIGSGLLLLNKASLEGPIQFNLPVVSSILGLIGALSSAIVGLTNNFFFKNVSHEDLKERFTEHPFEPIRKRFNQIAESNKLAIFIDDLDRCDVAATVTLLEGIQNLFKKMPVLYIIAADGQWVSNCFNQKYKDFETLTNDGCTIGDKFLQKTFQLTLNVPKPDPEDLKLYWDNLIGQAEILDSTTAQQDGPTAKPKEGERKEKFRQSVAQRSQQKAKKLNEVKKEIEENIEHYLRKFIDLGVPDNPRQMKRFVNQYEVTRQTMVVEGTNRVYENQDDDRIVKFLIFSMRYPSLADQLKRGEITKEEILKKDKDKLGVDLTSKDRNDIEKLLENISDDLIKGDFYSI